ncbi:MAG TPA: YjjG family noncanonical pyrimidine nucleotidase [Cytophagaceae bacterium]|jgi:putative hydrolase of the HAD superfamily|nr:YjjG family noncanonical pyrimidine nucleotidase [Cytophagaceae bacterium]
MENYKHIFFDLDHTLWDFNTNCRLTLNELYKKHNFHRLGFSDEIFYTEYKKINDQMWQDYHKGFATKEDIRTKRFHNTFSILGCDPEKIPADLENEFLKICPTKGQVFPFTHEMLDYLTNKGYFLHIITNGFKETQHIKLSTSDLSDYFTHVIESEVCGFMKPDKRIFEYALNLSNATVKESIMIGDDFHADILGAKNMGLDQIFVNRTNFIHTEFITHEIDCLSKLKGIL